MITQSDDIVEFIVNFFLLTKIFSYEKIIFLGKPVPVTN